MPTLTHLVVFTAPITGIGAVATGEIMRVPNRPDLLPAGGLFLRSPDGALLAPAAIALDDPPVSWRARTMLVPVPGEPGDRTRIWLATLTVRRHPVARRRPLLVRPPGGGAIVSSFEPFVQPTGVVRAGPDITASLPSPPRQPGDPIVRPAVARYEGVAGRVPSVAARRQRTDDLAALPGHRHVTPRRAADAGSRV